MTEPVSVIKKLTGYAYRLLARRRYTVYELRKKLTERRRFLPQITGEDIEILITYLEERNYLNDEEYATLFVDSELRRKPQGLPLLKQKLAAKGISKELIQATLAQKTITETGLAQGALAKKLKTFSKLSPQKQYEKSARFLASRGFNSGTISTVLHGKFLDNRHSITE